MEASSILLFHLVSPVEETMTLFLSGFKHFYGPLPVGHNQGPPQVRTGKVRTKQSLLRLQAPLHLLGH
jgi:hypothetical protein